MSSGIRSPAQAVCLWIWSPCPPPCPVSRGHRVDVVLLAQHPTPSFWMPWLIPLTWFMFSYDLFFFLTLQYCIVFAIYQHESTTGIHVFPILNPPPSPYHPSGSSQCTSPKHPALCIEPGLVPNLSSLNYECAPDSSIYDFFPPMVLTLKLVRSQVYFKAMAFHSSTLAWKIPWTEEPGGAAVHGIAKSRTRLSDFTFAFHFHALEKEMATHSSVLAWRIPEMGEPGGLPSMGSHRV